MHLPEVTIRPINTLAITTSKPVDEISGLPATLQATVGGVTFYYSSLENQQLDYEAILHRVAPLMAELQALSGGASATERSIMTQRLAKMHKELASVCIAAATTYLTEKRYDLAVPPALRGLRGLRAMHGDGAMELVMPYLLLAEAELGLGRTSQAEEFLANANFILVKNGDAPHSLHARMHRDFGRVYSAQGNHPAALDHFAKDVLHTTLILGPDSIETSIGYFFMAQVFASQAKMDAAMSFFDKVVDIWFRHLLGARAPTSTALGLDWGVTSPDLRLGVIGRRARADLDAAEGGKAPLTSEMGADMRRHTLRDDQREGHPPLSLALVPPLGVVAATRPLGRGLRCWISLLACGRVGWGGHTSPLGRCGTPSHSSIWTGTATLRRPWIS